MSETSPFLIGEAMTGGYGKGADILHSCTIAVGRGQIDRHEGGLWHAVAARGACCVGWG